MPSKQKVNTGESTADSGSGHTPQTSTLLTTHLNGHLCAFATDNDARQVRVLQGPVLLGKVGSHAALRPALRLKPAARDTVGEALNFRLSPPVL